MDERVDGVLTTVALKIGENDGKQYAGDYTASGKYPVFGLKYLIFGPTKAGKYNNTNSALCQYRYNVT